MIQITLGDERLPRILYQKDGTERSFEVDHNTLFEFIQRNCFERKETKTKLDLPVFESPVLPSGVVKYMALPDGKIAVFLEQKTFSHDIHYHGTLFKEVPFPNLVFVFTFQPTREGKYRYITRKLYTHKASVLREDTPLFKWPFAHTHGDHSMCFHFENEIKDLAQLCTFVDIWINAEINDHFYSNNGNDRNLWTKPLREIFEETQETKQFDFDKLVSAKITIRELAGQIVKGYFPNCIRENEEE